MANDNELAIVKRELRAVGIRPQIEDTNGGHIRVSWQATPDKPPRTMVVPKSGSDFRGRLNARADCRKLLRADNVTLQEKIKAAPKTTFERAISVPTETETVSDQLAAIRCELADLTSFMIEKLTEIAKATAPAPAPVPTLEAAPELAPGCVIPQEMGTAKKRTRNMTAVTEFLHAARWASIDDVARAAKFTYAQAYGKLRKAVEDGTVERKGHSFRLMPKPVERKEKKDILDFLHPAAWTTVMDVVRGSSLSYQQAYYRLGAAVNAGTVERHEQNYRLAKPRKTNGHTNGYANGHIAEAQKQKRAPHRAGRLSA